MEEADVRAQALLASSEARGRALAATVARLEGKAEAREEALDELSLYSLEERRVLNGRAAGRSLAEEARHAEAVRCVQKLASGGAAVKAKGDKAKVVALVRESVLESKWSEERGMLDEPLPISVARDAHMGLDILRTLKGLHHAWQLFATPATTYQHEEGVDQLGLSVDLLSKAFGALRALRLPVVPSSVGGGGASGRAEASGGWAPEDQPATSLFEMFDGGLCLPARDVSTRDAPPLLLSRPSGHSSSRGSDTHPIHLEDASSTEPAGARDWAAAPQRGSHRAFPATSQPPAAASSSGPSSLGVPPSVDSLEAWRLIGRLLAWALCLPEGFYVDDCFPDWVLEYLCTDNFESIRRVEGALAALAQLSGAGVSTLSGLCLGPPCAELDGYLMGASPVRCDLLPHGYRPDCAFWSADVCPCATDGLCDATKQSDFLCAVWDTYVAARCGHLDALKDGFQGADWALAERQLRDSAGVLQLLRAPALAARLRGRPVVGGVALWEELDVLRQEVDDEEATWRGVSADEYDETAGWLKDYVAALDARGAQLLLKFITGTTALVPPTKRGADYTRTSVLVLNDWLRPLSESAGLPTASICACQLYLPVYPSRDVFLAKVELALATYESEERQAGGSAFGCA